MARWIPAGSWVADFGCGEQRLRGNLPENCTYIPVDYKKRSADTMVADFNAYQFPCLYVDVAFVAGVLEYITDLEWFSEQLANHAEDLIIVSYCCAEGDLGDSASRRKRGWVNDLTAEEVEQLFVAEGFELEQRDEVIRNTLFSFRRRNRRNPYGVLVYPTGILNLGDYTQTAAALALVGRPDDAVYLGREDLTEFRGKPLRVICNGWFSHHAIGVPASPLAPIYISVHVTPGARVWFSSPEMQRHLQQWGPVGCRDQATADFFATQGVDAYVSGCVTLALGKSMREQVHGVPTTSEVFFVDPPVQVGASRFGKLVAALRGLTGVGWFFQAWPLTRIHQGGLRKLLFVAMFVGQYRHVLSGLSQKTTRFESQLLPIGKGHSRCRDLFRRVRDGVLAHVGASSVVTSRIHVALPATSAGANVIFLLPNITSAAEAERVLDHTRYFGFAGKLSSDRAGQRLLAQTIHGTPHRIGASADVDALVSSQTARVRTFLANAAVASHR